VRDLLDCRILQAVWLVPHQLVEGSERGGMVMARSFIAPEKAWADSRQSRTFRWRDCECGLCPQRGPWEIPVQAALRSITAPPRAQSAVGRAGGRWRLAHPNRDLTPISEIFPWAALAVAFSQRDPEWKNTVENWSQAEPEWHCHGPKPVSYLWL